MRGDRTLKFVGANLGPLEKDALGLANNGRGARASEVGRVKSRRMLMLKNRKKYLVWPVIAFSGI